MFAVTVFSCASDESTTCKLINLIGGYLISCSPHKTVS